MSTQRYALLCTRKTYLDYRASVWTKRALKTIGTRRYETVLYLSVSKEVNFTVTCFPRIQIVIISLGLFLKPLSSKKERKREWKKLPEGNTTLSSFSHTASTTDRRFTSRRPKISAKRLVPAEYCFPGCDAVQSDTLHGVISHKTAVTNVCNNFLCEFYKRFSKTKHDSTRASPEFLCGKATILWDMADTKIQHGFCF